ncbi:Protein of unknown function [Propionibacterium freudenreichii]|nr:Protein of unknown function [Propionibacterium freudenreichii]CEI47985.1 Protein of unknown function [Propionibacterium freudenreichii]
MDDSHNQPAKDNTSQLMD